MKVILVSLLMAGGIMLGAVQADDPIMYSGANRNVVYSRHTVPTTISLFDAPAAWDDMRLRLQVLEMPPFENTYSLGNMLSQDGNQVAFAVGSRSADIKRFEFEQIIGPAQTFSGSYMFFTEYYEDLEESSSQQYGEFRNATGYAGLRFRNGADTYYGWIQVSVTNFNSPDITGTLIDWAYNSTPNSPIPAGVASAIAPITSVYPSIAMTWSSRSNVLYQVQSTASLSSPAWTNTGQHVLGSGGEEWSFQVITNNHHFFRIILSP